MAKSAQKIRARKLRSEGQSIKEIAKNLNVSVGSVSTWVRDIILLPEQITLLQKRTSDPHYGRRAEYLRRIKVEHQEKVKTIYQKGAIKVGKLSQRDLFMLGLALYWGEGFKKDNLVGFATSDPDMALFFLEWLKIAFNIEKDALTLRVTVNASYREKIDQIKQFWSEYLNIETEHFSKPFFQNTVWKKQYEKPDEYHGVIRIRVRKSVNMLREILGSIEYLRSTSKAFRSVVEEY